MPVRTWPAAMARTPVIPTTIILFSLSAGSMPSSLFALDPVSKQAILGAYNNNLDKNVSNNLNFNLNLVYTFNPI